MEPRFLRFPHSVSSQVICIDCNNRANWALKYVVKLIFKCRFEYVTRVFNRYNISVFLVENLNDEKSRLRFFRSFR